WRNTGVGFSNVTLSATMGTGLPGAGNSSVAWMDYDGDGRLDFFLLGRSNSSFTNLISQLWRNTSNGFVNVTASVMPGLPQLAVGGVAWGDYDNDGRPDLLVAGSSNNVDAFTQV